MDTAYDRVDKLLKARDMTWADLGRQIGAQDQVLHNWKKRGIPTARYERIARALNVTVDYISTGRSPQHHPAKASQDAENGDFVFIPMLNVQASAGEGSGADVGEIELMETLAFRGSWLRKKNLPLEKLEVYTATGNSMAPYLMDGDVVLVEITDDKPKSGEVWVIWQGSLGLRVKRIFLREGGDWVIRSDNPDKSLYPDEVVHPTYAGQIIRPIGRVVWRGG